MGIIAMGRTRNKQSIIASVADKTGMEEVKARDAVNAALEIITQTVGRGEAVHVVGFGRFETYERQARAGSHPRTHAPMQISAARLPVFRPSERLRERFKEEQTF